MFWNSKSDKNGYSIIVSSFGDVAELSRGVPEDERESERRNVLDVMSEWYPDRDLKTVDVKVIEGDKRHVI